MCTHKIKLAVEIIIPYEFQFLCDIYLMISKRTVDLL